MVDEMRTGTHNGNLMVAALKRHRDKPVIYLGDTTLTGGEVAEQMSRYVQAFESLGAGNGTSGALLALNRPEVLFILGAGQTQGFRRTSLHPLGSADDHATAATFDAVPSRPRPCRRTTSSRSPTPVAPPGSPRVSSAPPRRWPRWPR